MNLFPLLAASACLLLPVSAAGAKPPNALFIAIDDHNDWIGAFGGRPMAETLARFVEPPLTPVLRQNPRTA